MGSTIGYIVKIIDDYEAVINAGRLDGLAIGEELVVYREGEMIVDPVTGEDLETLELAIIRVKVKHVQDKISIVESNETVKVRARRTISTLYEESESQPKFVARRKRLTWDTFEGEKGGIIIGDLVKYV